MLKFLFYFLLFTVLIRFVMRVVLPLIRTTRQVQSRMREMQDQMNQMQHQKPGADANRPTMPRQGEYIEYEEVR